MMDDNKNKNSKELTLNELDNISGGVGFDAPYWFLDSIPDETLCKAWKLAFCIPQNFSSWNEYSNFLTRPDLVRAWMEAGRLEGISEREFINICRQAMMIQKGKMDYPTF
ncbi:MAG: hypothetical protein J6D29_08950 [Solobacterium sp.]|nr:hypothetical protein [Solobacterium sp.]